MTTEEVYCPGPIAEPVPIEVTIFDKDGMATEVTRLVGAPRGYADWDEIRWVDFLKTSLANSYGGSFAKVLHGTEHAGFRVKAPDISHRDVLIEGNIA